MEGKDLDKSINKLKKDSSGQSQVDKGMKETSGQSQNPGKMGEEGSGQSQNPGKMGDEASGQSQNPGKMGDEASGQSQNPEKMEEEASGQSKMAKNKRKMEDRTYVHPQNSPYLQCFFCVKKDLSMESYVLHVLDNHQDIKPYGTALSSGNLECYFCKWLVKLPSREGYLMHLDEKHSDRSWVATRKVTSVDSGDGSSGKIIGDKEDTDLVDPMLAEKCHTDVVPMEEEFGMSLMDKGKQKILHSDLPSSSPQKRRKGNKGTLSLSCYFCGEMVSYGAAYTDHVREEHLSEEFNVQCTYCPKVERTREEMISHLRQSHPDMAHPPVRASQPSESGDEEMSDADAVIKKGT